MTSADSRTRSCLYPFRFVCVDLFVSRNGFHFVLRISEPFWSLFWILVDGWRNGYERILVMVENLD